ncbi:MAG TPA: 3'-5' exonuclease [Gemmatimonadaceae bacterium]|nr:3'-5' exonuclease [Gemmatimonadaceae bacterium]
MVEVLQSTGRYQVIERLEYRPRYNPEDGSSKRIGLFVDVETTGLDATTDKIIELSVVRFEFSREGKIFNVFTSESWYEDPGCPIPELITELTGIKDSDVSGKSINETRVNQLVDGADLIVAHNASFDRPFCECRLAAFARKHWACSCDDINWPAEGFRYRSLEWLAYKQCGMFYQAHRADADCYMGIHVLSTILPKSRRTAMAALLESARCATVRVWAINASFFARGVLKNRGYRWSDGADGRPKAWWRCVKDNELDQELAWLTETVYPSEGLARPVIQRFDGKLRFSTRSEVLPLLSVTYERAEKELTSC